MTGKELKPGDAVTVEQVSVDRVRLGSTEALVYRAESDANVDLAKFYLDPELSNRTATFSKADISGGAYAGWKAIVVNVAEGSGAAAPVDTSGYARWTATAAGGGWSSPGNWENGVLPDASHLAVFGAPGAAGVAVNLDVEPLLEKLYIEGSDAGKGYAFGGSRPLGFDGGAFGSALLEIAGGSHAFTAPLKIDRLLTMNAAAGSTTWIEFPVWISSDLRSTAFTWTFQAVF